MAPLKDIAMPRSPNVIPLASYQSRLRLSHGKQDADDVSRDRQSELRRAQGRPDKANKVGTGHDDPSGWNKRDAADIGTMNRGMNNPHDEPIVGDSIVDIAQGVAMPVNRTGDAKPIDLGDGSGIIDLNPFANADIEDRDDEERPFAHHLAD